MGIAIVEAARTATTAFDLGAVGYATRNRDVSLSFMFSLDVTAHPAAAETLTPTFRLWDDALATPAHFSFWTLPAVPEAVARYTYVCHPDEPTAVGHITTVLNSHVPMSEKLDIQIVHSASGSWTYTGTIIFYMYNAPFHIGM